jgi:hypothetical protein
LLSDFSGATCDISDVGGSTSVPKLKMINGKNNLPLEEFDFKRVVLEMN